MKKLIVIGLSAVVAAPLVWLARPAYESLLARRLLHAAQGAARQGKEQEAEHLCRLALARDPRNGEILRAYADLLSRRHDPQLLQVREQIRQLQPSDVGAFFDCVEAAIIYQQPQEARALLVNHAPAGAQGSARYYHLLCVSHFIANEMAEADAASTEALRREPNNKVFLADQASIRLCSLDPAVRDQARATLLAYVSDHDERRTALRALLLDAAQLPPDAKEPDWLGGLLAETRKSIVPADAFFPDYLLALRRWRPDEFATVLAEYLKAAAGQDPGALFAQRWLDQQHLFQQQLDFRKALPTTAQTTLESLLFAAEAKFQLRQIDELKALLGEPAWVAYPAFAGAWAERIRRTGNAAPDDDSGRASNWHKILAAAGQDADSLSTLSRLALNWRWAREYEETLWRLSVAQPRLSRDALRQLSDFYVETGDASGLQRVLKQKLALDPDDAVARNNFAYASFLLGRESSIARKFADDLCARYPDSLGFAATRAFGLYKSGDVTGALQSLERFQPEQLRGTPQSVTYGLVLAANGNPLARDFLKDAEHWTHFPEERQLVEESAAKLGR